MSKFTITTHTKAKQFIESLDRARKARVDRIYYLFEEYGTFLPTKFLKKLSADVWELRPGDIRLFLAIKGNKGYVVHGVYKKTQKTPKKDLELSTKRIKEETRLI